MTLDGKGIMFFLGLEDHQIGNHLTREFAAGFDELGYQTRLVRLPVEQDDDALYREIQEINCGLIISMAGLGLARAQPVIKKFDLHLPVFSMFLDPINTYWPRVEMDLPNHFIGCLSEQDASFTTQYSTAKKPSFQLNHAALPKKITPWEEKDIPLFFCASLRSLPEDTRATWKEHGPGIESVLNHIRDLHLQGPGRNMFADIITVLNAVGSPYSIQDLNAFFCHIDLYFRNLRRVEAFKMIAREVPILLAGDGWEKVIENDFPKLKYLGRIHPDEVREYNMRSKMVLNVINFYHESHERVFSTMADGAVVLSSNSNFYEQSFNRDEGLFFNWNDTDICERVTTLMDDDAALQAMAEAGTKAFEKGHTWKHRAERLIANMFPNA